MTTPEPLTPAEEAELRNAANFIWPPPGGAGRTIDRLLATLDAERAARQAPDTNGLREAIEDVLRNGSAYHDVGSIRAALRAALAAPERPLDAAWAAAEAALPEGWLFLDLMSPWMGGGGAWHARATNTNTPDSMWDGHIHVKGDTPAAALLALAARLTEADA